MERQDKQKQVPALAFGIAALLAGVIYVEGGVELFQKYLTNLRSDGRA